MNKKRESGTSGGLVYATCAAGVIIAFTIYVLEAFVFKCYALRDELATKMHIVESYCLTANQLADGRDSFERELNKKQIITAIAEKRRSNGTLNPDDNWPRIEEQLINIGEKFSQRMKEELCISGSTSSGYTDVTNGLLSTMGRSKVSIDHCYIYEPIYSLNAQINAGSVDAAGHVSGITIQYPIESWYVYELRFNGVEFVEARRLGKVDAGYSGGKVNYEDKWSHNMVLTPTLSNGNRAEGATIEATINVRFYGPQSLVWKVRESEKEFDISVTQSVDIVFAENDSRWQ